MNKQLNRRKNKQINKSVKWEKREKKDKNQGSKRMRR